MPLELKVWLHSLGIIAAAYLLGSIPTGYLLMRFVRKQDIRTIGSGNIGATNVLRSGAKGLGAATFLFDVLKGAMAVLVGARLATDPAFRRFHCTMPKRSPPSAPSWDTCFPSGSACAAAKASPRLSASSWCSFPTPRLDRWRFSS